MLLPVMNFAAPAAGFAAPLLDELLEVLDRLIDFTRQYTYCIASLFHCGFGLVLHRKHNTRATCTDRLEANLAGIRCSRNAAPRDDAVWHLLGIFTTPFLFLPRHGNTPVQMRIVRLHHFLHAIHETWKFFKLRPLVISCTHRHTNLKLLLNSFHLQLPP